jgi:hypothetical protein
VPFGCGLVKMQIRRQAQLLNKVYPGYTLSIECGAGNYPLLFAKKLKFKKKATYAIATDQNFGERSIIGKMKNKNKGAYTLYDNGANPKKATGGQRARQEYGAFFFRYEPCQVGNIRRIAIALPNLLPCGVGMNETTKLDNDYFRPGTLFRICEQQPTL